MNFVAVGAVVSLGLAAAGSHFHVRPHLVTLASMAITAVVLIECERLRKEEKDPHPQPLSRGERGEEASPFVRLFWLIPLFIIWTNVHGGVLGGLATLVITASGWVVFWRLGLFSPVKSWRDAVVLGLVVAGCFASVLVNPYGTDLVKTWRIIMDEPLLKQIIIEHRPLDPAQPYSWPIFGLAVVYLIVLAGANRRDLRVTWLLPLVWFVLTIDRCRHASLFVVVTLAVLADMWPSSCWAAWPGAEATRFPRPVRRAATAAVVGDTRGFPSRWCRYPWD